jgi:tetratricopeptide (TPR) repeat protein
LNLRYIINSIVIFLLGALSVQSATITGIELGDHPNFTLLVITFDREIQYQVKQEPYQVTLDFSSPVQLKVPESELSDVKNRMIKSVRYLSAQNRLVVETKQNYSLSIHKNFPYSQLILDFAHSGVKVNERPAPPPKKEIKTELPIKKESPPVVPQPAPTSIDTAITDPYRQGLFLKEKGDLEGALSAFQSALATRKTDARYQIALLYEELNQRDKAIAELITLVNDNPAWMEPRIKLGLLYQLNGKEDLAEGIWQQIFNSTEFDSDFAFHGMEGQVALLDSLLAGKEAKEKAPPVISLENLPKLPYKWILLIIALGGTVVLARVISNWRMNRLINNVLDSDVEESPVAPPSEKPVQDKIDILVSDEGAQPSPEPPLPETSAEDEAETAKQQMIYDLSQQNYTIAEIAKMMDMGQEEVKFILDFRQKGEKKSKRK